MKKFTPNYVPHPWTDVQTSKTDNGVKFDVWGRTYTVDNNVLFSSVVSQGHELLAAPMRLISKENGEDSVWNDFEVYLMEGANNCSSTICATGRSNAFYINTSLTVAYDGCVKGNIKIMPRGFTVREVFFVGEQNLPEYRLDSLWLEIPLKREAARFYQIYPRSAVTLPDGTEKPWSRMNTGDEVLAGTTKFPFKHQMMLSDGNIGLGCFFESDQLWHPKDENSVVECIANDDEVILRFHLLDEQPKQWKPVSRNRDITAFRPITFDFGMQTIPFRPLPENMYTEHNVHIDCFKKIDNDYEDYLLEPYVTDDGVVTDEIVLDRMQRLGVNTLYLHEKWNTCQNSVWLTTKAADRLHLIVREAHKRGIKVIPYFGYEVSSLSPEWAEKAEKMILYHPEGRLVGMWNRVPFQCDTHICQGSDWQDDFCDGIERIYREFNIDGIYLDGTVTAWECYNENHGCGYRDEEGKLHPTCSFWGVRNMMQRLYEITEKYHGVMNCHTSGAFTLSALSHCHSIWEGEDAQFVLMKGELDRMPENFYKGQFLPQQYGLPLNMLCYENRPHWTYQHSNAFSLLLGIIPKPNEIGEFLEDTSALWDIFDSIPFAKATWHPYFKNDGTITSSAEPIKSSYYKYTDVTGATHLLAFVSNIEKSDAENVTLTVKGAKSIYQLRPEKSLITNENTVSFEIFEGFSNRIYDIVID